MDRTRQKAETFGFNCRSSVVGCGKSVYRGMQKGDSLPISWDIELATKAASGK
jgi:hypothetical protein